MTFNEVLLTILVFSITKDLVLAILKSAWKPE
jgi:hypothetical protein